MSILNCNWRYWDTTKNSDVVGWPQGGPGKLWASQRLAQMMPELRAAGFTGVSIWPVTEGAAGIFSGGYDKRDDYGLDNTAFGNAEMLRQLIACAHANGLQVYVDLVLHQYDGGHNGVYNTKRFPKTAKCFAAETTPGGVAADPVPDEEGNFAFGDLAAYVAAEPPGYMHDGAIAAAQFLAATTGLDGLRIDDAKGTNAAIVYDILHAPGLADLEAYFEYFDGSPGPVANYVHGYEKGRGSVMDFAFKFNMGNICNNQGRVWMGAMANIGYCVADPYHAWTFVESADSDTTIGQQTIWNKMLAYAALLTYPGQPAPYYRDWSDDPLCYDLKKRINNLNWVHQHLAQGDFKPLINTNSQVFVMARLGYGDAPGCIVAFNNDPTQAHTVTVPTHFTINERLHEYSGNADYNSDIWVSEQQTATLTVPKNSNGLSYVIYAPWITRPAFDPKPILTRQTLFGAADLGPAQPAAENGTQIIGRFDIAYGSAIAASITADRTGWEEYASIEFQIRNSYGEPSGGGVLGLTGSSTQARGTAHASGWHTISLTGNGLPEGGSSYEFAIAYNAPLTPTLTA